jgi:hypothetical protein
MKIIPTTKLALLLCTAFAAALLTFTPSARALTIRANYDTPSGASDRVTYVNHLIGMDRGTEDKADTQVRFRFSPLLQAMLADHANRADDLHQVITIPVISGVPSPGSGTGAVPDGGITVMLLGTALGALGMAKRYIMS